MIIFIITEDRVHFNIYNNFIFQIQGVIMLRSTRVNATTRKL